MELTILDRGLGFRIDVDTTVLDTDVLAMCERMFQVSVDRFKYGIFTIPSKVNADLGSACGTPAMRAILKLVDACPDLFLAIAGPLDPFVEWRRYAPVLRQLSWRVHRCDAVDDALTWVSASITQYYGVIPDFVHTIPIPHSIGRSD